MDIATNLAIEFPCMLCKKTKFKKLGHVPKTMMIFGTCKNCKLTQTYIRWVESDFQKYYSSGEYLKDISGAVEPNKWHFNYGLENRKFTVKEIKNYITKKDKILEFGCSSGALVYMLKEYNVLGVDIDLGAIKFAKTKNINVSKIDIFQTNEKYDVIYCSHVFEHLSNPQKYIDKLYDLLNENGKLIIVVPAFLACSEWANLPHLVYYQAITLQNFFIGKKWKINNIKYFNKENYRIIRWYGKWLNFLFKSNYCELLLVATKNQVKNYSYFLKKESYYKKLLKWKAVRFLALLFSKLF